MKKLRTGSLGLLLIAVACSHSGLKVEEEAPPTQGLGGGASGFAPTTAQSFTREQIVFPKAQPEIERFLKLAAESKDEEIRKAFSGSASLRPIPSEGTAVFSVRGRQYMIYHDDLNHDGTMEYLVIFLREGKDQKNGIQGAYRVEFGDGVERLEKIGAASLEAVMTPIKAGYQLAAPFVVKMNEAKILRFNDPQGGQHAFVWEGDKLSDILF